MNSVGELGIHMLKNEIKSPSYTKCNNQLKMDQLLKCNTRNCQIARRKQEKNTNESNFLYITPKSQAAKANILIGLH